MPALAASQDMPMDDLPDLFKSENTALDNARATYAAPDAHAQVYCQSLGELIIHFERLMRETRRLIGRSDRAEREMNALNLQLKTLAQQLEHRATHDALTGVLNRGAVIELAGQALRDGSVVMIVLDIDYFKRVNDDFGHPTGDAVIQGIVTCLRRIVADRGVIGRVGGEEFTVLLSTQNLDEGVRLAEAMRDAVASHVFEAPVNRPITASFGVSISPGGTDFDTAYGIADAALYDAKRNGRNRVEVAV
ncbi:MULTISPECIES: GGDEF domain-containing protein [unclassified Pseudomonas]|uniref:GGDEF domain-containing protein n=1 Tax=unclassified Pseudomonas TaxID=196821 RepID=UPI002AC90C9D|nr:MULTISPECIES: GGDEF domain-containing protein [unclassified Pseudomonas]MEB0041934.1 GGDEF domain-containing protein [Pseudomonas sp. MH10]MEB0076607.1 GGDEF domain-containing protein [Pseudomonas sp. MH10out]MEB0090466.1 GGDEF domain-containing protein [Pseudomonas sp. CCI4.2]MEB0100695.1 GGDEF domain-containing protein [Pseudomonas sp. CCI3.2]MEB0123051.1 GGDEF domain-containing protein [Pseudomonas sp. CCI1.2]